MICCCSCCRCCCCCCCCYCCILGPSVTKLATCAAQGSNRTRENWREAGERRQEAAGKQTAQKQKHLQCSPITYEGDLCQASASHRTMDSSSGQGGPEWSEVESPPTTQQRKESCVAWRAQSQACSCARARAWLPPACLLAYSMPASCLAGLSRLDSVFKPPPRVEF